MLGRTMTVNFSNNPYKNFIQMSGQKTPVTAPVSPESANLAQPQIASVKVGDVNDQNEKHGTNHKKIFGIIGISVGSVALLTLIGLFTLSKGFAGGFAKKLNKLSKSLQKGIYDLSAETKELTTSQKMKLRLSKMIQPLADTMQASSNITSVKDSWFRHWLKKFGMEPAVQKLNNAFKGVVTKNTRNYYTKAETSNLQFCSYLDDLIRETTDPKVKAQLGDYAKNLKELFKNNFTTAEHFERTNKLYKEMSGLDEKVYNTLFADGGMFKNMKKYKSYITTDLVADKKKFLVETLAANKAKLSNNVTDNYNNIRQLLNEIKINVNPKDEKAVDIVKKLSETLEAYKTASGPQEKAARDKIYHEFKSHMGRLSEVFQKDKQYAGKFEEVQAKINEFYTAIDPKVAKKGLAQDTITFIKEVYGKDSVQYKQAKQYMTVLNNNLNTAINSEINSFEKLAELQVGSVPTDILGIIGPATIATAMVVSADNKEQRVSKTLTQGIPILGGIATSYYGTTRGWTGAKNLMLGLGTGYLLNIIGAKTDELYKKYAEKQNVLKSAFEAFNKLQHKTDAPKTEAVQK